MEQPEDAGEYAHQPEWTVSFEANGDDAPPSRFVEVRLTHQLEVVDVEALRAAVEALDGPPRDDLARRLREVPANLVANLMRGPLPLPDLPGVMRRRGSLSAGDYAPDS